MGLTVFKQFFHDTLLMFSSSTKFQEQVKGRKKGRWQLFQATDFQSLMYPCFIFCRILGIFPYKINTSSYKISRPCYILWTIMKCIICFYMLIILYVINSGWFEFKSIRRMIDVNGFYIVGSFIIIITYISDGPRKRLLQTIQAISSGLPLESYQAQSILIHAKDIFGLPLLLMQMWTGFKLQTPMFFKVSTFYVTLVVFQMDMLYMNCVCVLKICFKKINDDLVNLLVMNNKPHLLRWIYCEQRNLFLLMELKALKKYHLMVSNTVQMLNTIFSLQLLASTVITFVKITFCLYFCFILWQDVMHTHFSSSERSFAYVFFIWSAIYYFIKMALIVWACETGKDQANEIGVTIHDVFNNINDEQVKQELQLFSLQILQTRQNMFTAKGFTIDAPFFATLIGSITTYIFILIQFLHMSSSCNK